MNCEDARTLLSEYEAGEAPPETAEKVREHLGACPACARLLEAMRDVAEVAAAPDEDVPRSLALRILAQVDDALRGDLADAPEVMTPEELARFLRVSADALDDLADLIPGVEIGGRLRFRKDRVVEWLEERERWRGDAYRGSRGLRPAL